LTPAKILLDPGMIHSTVALLYYYRTKSRAYSKQATFNWT